ncbi:MAG: peptidylprolyl isomerase [Flavobacteriaceae bacterium]|nr:peptidylprolyl isomerase [Flavobacteriaceae bacterium]
MTASRIIFFASLVLISCDNSNKSLEDNLLARVNDDFLTIDQIDTDIFNELNFNDSVVQIKNYITEWATRKLLEEGANLNLENQKQFEFNSLIEKYKSDLYTSAYLDALVNKSLDTIISKIELKEIYEDNKELFVLNEDLIKLRYIIFESNISDQDEIKSLFMRYSEEDKVRLKRISNKFKSFFFNDSIWIRSKDIIEKIPALNYDTGEILSKNMNFIQFKDSVGLYLININDFANVGNQAPISYIEPTLRQIIINKRKYDLAKKLKVEILNNAIKNKKFQVYE